MQQNERGQKRRTLDAKVVNQEARGQWLSILEALAPGLSPAIDKLGRHVACPVHGGEDGFRLFKDADETGGGICNTCGSFKQGLSLLMWYNEWSFPQAIEAVGLYLRLTPEDNESLATVKPRPQKPREESEEERKKRAAKDARLRESLKRVWNESLSLTDVSSEPVRLYLARRGLSLRYALASPVLRYHPAMPYFEEGKKIGTYPCMLALAHDAEGVPVTLHRTFLTEEGYKAPVPCAKKLMPYPSDRKVTGGGIPLLGISRGNMGGKTAIGVTEGIETALAVIEATKGELSVWPLISDRLLEAFVPPEHIDTLCIYGDQDRNQAGRAAAANLKQRLMEEADIEVRGFLPQEKDLLEDEKGVDWLDILNRKGGSAIPVLSGLLEDREASHG